MIHYMGQVSDPHTISSRGLFVIIDGNVSKYKIPFMFMFVLYVHFVIIKFIKFMILLFFYFVPSLLLTIPNIKLYPTSSFGSESKLVF